MVNVACVMKSGVEGPGTRLGIWFQGCGRDCPGCFNQALRSHEKGKYTELSEILSLIADVEGITLSGGEPLDQIEAACDISVYARSIGMSVLVYTGYEPEGMSSYQWENLRRVADIAIVGPYVREIPQVHAWAGSGNQRIIRFTDKYSDSDVMAGGMTGKFEVRISPDGYVVTGFPPRSVYGDQGIPASGSCDARHHPA